MAGRSVRKGNSTGCTGALAADQDELCCPTWGVGGMLAQVNACCWQCAHRRLG